MDKLNREGMQLQNAGVAVTERGAIQVDSRMAQSSASSMKWSLQLKSHRFFRWLLVHLWAESETQQQQDAGVIVFITLS
ncbi:hypothetical protein [Paenibacillus sp. yr247]|uniref:hypothetical protein n=1 Tax=Paenibacillus sp. yr247 TaxID=1761880 RepID=UPI000B80E836|nr:hypothetical protein [Paenibacillus sp. yr247]